LGFSDFDTIGRAPGRAGLNSTMRYGRADQMNMTLSHLSRRHFLQALGVLAANIVLASGEEIRSSSAGSRENDSVEYGKSTLPRGVRSRRVDTNNGVVLHILEAGFETHGRPCVVLLHGFPELAYCWRNQLLPLARAGFHAVAPDLRGYGLSVSKAVSFDDDLLPYSMLNRVGDVLGLICALGYEKVSAVVGHDWGGPTAQWCARLRPDVFQSVVSVSTPFLRAAGLPLGTAETHANAAPEGDIEKELAALPRPRKHYARYGATRDANEDLWRAPQGVHDLLRELYYFKSADWKGNKPFPLKAWTALELAKMPTYYIMDLNKGIAATMAEHQPSTEEIAACRWMTEADLQVYSQEFTRTGFQGGLNYYRVEFDPGLDGELNAFAGKTIDVPACYIGGSREWAVYQSPGAFETMHSVCTRLKGVHLVSGAGHSVAEEQPEAVNRILIEFLST
jgi:pimeloyl-ACP methyl ester carboxylesterase